jgi:hypothetical protein
MPRSRKRLRPKVCRTTPSGAQLALDHLFDQAKFESRSAECPGVLYHYTNWAGAEGILSNQQFWATSHDCTNDEAELVSAEAVIIEVAKELLANASGTPAKVLDSFNDKYSSRRVTESIAVCLTCFTVARDDKEQWRKYGADGGGICLGLRMLAEPAPESPSAALVKVQYSESKWRDYIKSVFENTCSLLSRHESRPEVIELGLSALNRFAEFQSITAKRPEWAAEQEYRHVTLVPRNASFQLKQRESAGKTISYLPVSLRRDGRRLAFAEILIGPNCSAEKTRQELQKLLARNGYERGSLEYPTIAVSKVPSWHSAG